MSTKSKAVKAPKTKASDMFFLAAITFLLILTEPILNTLFNVHGFGLTVAFRAVYIVIWVFGAKGLISTAKRECNFDILKKEAPSALQWVIVSIIAAAACAYFVWLKFDILAFNFKGLNGIKNIVSFVSMYILNAAKAITITLLIAFVQKGGTLVFKRAQWIPWGGIALGLMWAVMFVISNYDIWANGLGFNWKYAIYQFLYGLLCGVLYVSVGNKARYAFPFILLAALFIFLS